MQSNGKIQVKKPQQRTILRREYMERHKDSYVILWFEELSESNPSRFKRLIAKIVANDRAKLA